MIRLNFKGAWLNLINRLKMDDVDYQLHSLMYSVAKQNVEERLFDYYETIYPHLFKEDICKLVHKRMRGVSNKKIRNLYLRYETDCEYV